MSIVTRPRLVRLATRPLSENSRSFSGESTHGSRSSGCSPASASLRAPGRARAPAIGKREPFICSQLAHVA